MPDDRRPDDNLAMPAWVAARCHLAIAYELLHRAESDLEVAELLDDEGERVRAAEHFEQAQQQLGIALTEAWKLDAL